MVAEDRQGVSSCLDPSCIYIYFRVVFPEKFQAHLVPHFKEEAGEILM